MIVEQYQNSIEHGIIIEHTSYSRKKKKYKNPATITREEAIEHLQPPILPEYLKGDDEDGQSGSEEEKDAKRLRSTYDYDRAMGIPQCNPLTWEGLVTGM